MPKIDIATVPRHIGTGYPPPFNAPSAERICQRFGDAGGLTGFGVNLMRLPAGQVTGLCPSLSFLTERPC